MNPRPHFGVPKMIKTISDLPIRQTWLDAIIDVLIRRPDGTADIKTICNEIMKTGRDTGTYPEETITRCINNFCGDANDRTRKPQYDLFERVGAATYRLRTWPARPDLINVQRIEFDNHSYSRCFEAFRIAAEKKYGEKFQQMTNRERLEAFVRNIQPGAPFHAMLQVDMQPPAIDLD